MKGQITSSNPIHATPTRSEATTKIRANPVFHVSLYETVLSASLLLSASHLSASGQQSLTRDTDPYMPGEECEDMLTKSQPQRKLSRPELAE